MQEQRALKIAELDALMDQLAEIERRTGGGSAQQIELQKKLNRVLHKLADLGEATNPKWLPQV